MAFFCPIFPKKAITNGRPGRPNDLQSDPSDGQIQPNTPIHIASDFEPTVDDEIGVRAGERVTALFRDQDWVFVRKDDASEGFVPAIFCTPLPANLQKPSSKQLLRKAAQAYFLPNRPNRQLNSAAELSAHSSTPQDSIDSRSPDSGSASKPKKIESHKAAVNVLSFLQSLDHESPGVSDDGMGSFKESAVDVPELYFDVKISPFHKNPQGFLVALYPFSARQEDDLSVEQGERLELLNSEDRDWLWVRHPESGREGFVPAVYTQPISEYGSNGSAEREAAGFGSEFYVLEDLNPVAKDDLEAVKGDWIYSGQSPQSAPGGWVWAYNPRTKQYGFVPSSKIRAPLTSSL